MIWVWLSGARIQMLTYTCNGFPFRFTTYHNFFDVSSTITWESNWKLFIFDKWLIFSLNGNLYWYISCMSLGLINGPIHEIKLKFTILWWCRRDRFYWRCLRTYYLRFRLNLIPIYYMVSTVGYFEWDLHPHPPS